MPYTLVSLFPKQIVEDIPTYGPSQFVIPAGPSVLVLPEVHTWQYIGENRTLRVPVPERQVAEEIVRSFTSSRVGIESGMSPALGLVEGAKNLKTVRELHPELINKLNGEQVAWFSTIVKRADDDWQKFRQHRQITDDQRMAAKALGLKREWIDVHKAEDFIECPACGTRLVKTVAICRDCGCIVNASLMTNLKFVGKAS